VSSFMANHPFIAAAGGAAVVFVLSQMIVVAVEYFLRWNKFRQAAAFARSLGKPLLVVGRPGSPARIYGCGDVCLDADCRVGIDCPAGGIVADIREIPFEKGYFGAVFCSHIVEFLPDVADARKAIAEMERVGDRLFLCYTLEPNLLWRWFGRTTRLWISPRKKSLMIKKRPW